MTREAVNDIAKQINHYICRKELTNEANQLHCFFKYYVAQSLNVDVSSFGKSIDEAINNLKEALGLYFEEEEAARHYQPIRGTLIGELNIKTA